MIDKYVESSSKSNTSKPPEEDEMEVRKLKLLYRNSKNPERDKSSGASSDEETTSSSLIPIPDTLRQMRNELKRTINDIGEHSEIKSSFKAYDVIEESTEKVRNSLDELRKKYTLKNETAVALKINSASLMLDDILNSNNLNLTSNKNLQTNFFKENDVTTNAVHESETSTTEDSVSSKKHCSHIPMPPILSHSVPPVPFGFSPLLCPKHGNTFQPVCGFSSPLEKGSKIAVGNSEENQRKKSLVERLQNLQIKYKIESVYKMMQKTNPFAKAHKDTPYSNIQQGIPSTNYQEDAVATDESPFCKCEASSCPGKKYPKRIIFDLVESTDISQSDCKSTESGEKSCTCPTEIKCICLNRRECNCPEVIPRCICTECTCRASKFPSENASKHGSPYYPPPGKTKDCTQTETKSVSHPSAPLKKEDDDSLLAQKGSNGRDKKDMVPFTKNFPDWKKHCFKERKLVERTDIYYFDHGNSAYYQTTDNHPIRYTECLVERTDEYATKFWAEFFGAIEVGIAFLVSFILQLYRFLFTSVIRSLTVGLLQIFSDYFFKPILTIIFNGIVQPTLILAYNIATSLRDLCLPISQIFGFFLKEVANIFKSCRLVEINNDKNRQASCNCENKV